MDKQHRQNSETFHKRSLRGLVVGLVALVLGLPVGSLHAETSAENLMNFPSFTAVLSSVAKLNWAMREAALNPMDKRRRHNVHVAMNELPQSIIGLANTFKDGKLHDSDFPLVQSILGGFVDVGAADRYKQFMKAPSADLIPNLGAGFPDQYISQAESSGAGQVSGISYDVNDSKAGYDPSVSSAGDALPVVNQKSAKNQALKNSQSEIDDRLGQLSFNSFDVNDTKVDANGSAVSTEVSEGVSTIKRGVASSESAESEDLFDQIETETSKFISRGVEASSGSTEGANAQIDRLNQAPSIKVIRANEENKNQLEEDFFEKMRTGIDDDAVKKEIKEPRSSSLMINSNILGAHPAYRLLGLIWGSRAHAAGGGGGGGGGCQDCQGAEGGGGGGNAAEILFGLAAIMSAAAPMVAAAIQADADKSIAKTNAETQIKLTEMTSQTSLALADQQAQIAMAQTQAAQDINAKNNQAVTDRLSLQLAQLSAARDAQIQQDEERFEYEQELNKERIALAQQQSDQNVQLAQQTLNAQLTQAGLTSGFDNSRNSGDRLSVSSVASARVGTTGNTGTANEISASQSDSAGLGDDAADLSGLAFYDSAANSARGFAASGTQASKPTGEDKLLEAVLTETTDIRVIDGKNQVFDAETGEYISKEEWDEKYYGVQAKGEASNSGASRGAAANPAAAPAAAPVGYSTQIKSSGLPSNELQADYFDKSTIGSVKNIPLTNTASVGNRQLAYVNTQLDTLLHGDEHHLVRGSEPKALAKIKKVSKEDDEEELEKTSSDLGSFLAETSAPTEGDSFVDFRETRQYSTAVTQGRAATGSNGHGHGTSNGGAVSYSKTYNPPMTTSFGRAIR